MVLKLESFLFVFVLFFSINFNCIYAGDVFISEINFIDSEFVEIYSGDYLNLSDKLFYDDIGINNANELKLIQEVDDSNFYLIVGSNFLDEFGEDGLNVLDGLDCNIYETQKTNLGYRGLKNAGEDFVLVINSSLNLSFFVDDLDFDLSFDENESLGVSDINDEFEIQNFSICGFDIIDYDNININNSVEISNAGVINLSLMVNSTLDNLTNLDNSSDFESNLNDIINDSSNSSSDINLSLSNRTFCDNDFEIVFKDKMTFSKIEFSFLTNVSDYIIEYWVENFGGEIVKNKYNTTNNNWKSYSPSGSTEIYYVRANLYDVVSGCKYNSSNDILYYNSDYGNVDLDDGGDKSSSSSSVDSDDDNEFESYIHILNKDELISSKSKTLYFEVYRGSDTKKRVFYVYLNEWKKASLEIDKFSKFKGRFYFGNLDGSFNISVVGLDKNDSVFVVGESSDDVFDLDVSQVDDKKKKGVLLRNFNINGSFVNFNIESFLNGTSDCYINFVRTKVSDVLSLNLTKGLFDVDLEINVSRFEEKLKKDKKDSNGVYKLSFYCKYKKQGLKSDNYISYNFNFSSSEFVNNVDLDDYNDVFEEVEKKNAVGVFENKSSIVFSVFDDNSLGVSDFKNEILQVGKQDFSFGKSEVSVGEGEVYVSKGVSLKKDSFFSIFVGVCILCIGFILVW